MTKTENTFREDLRFHLKKIKQELRDKLIKSEMFDKLYEKASEILESEDWTEKINELNDNGKKLANFAKKELKKWKYYRYFRKKQ